MSAFSLLENMVALALLSICLLGSARLFGEALQALHSNANRRAAVSLAEELISRLIVARNDIAGNTAAACTIAVDTCFADSSVEAWVVRWSERLGRALPAGRAAMAVSHDTATDSYLIDIIWTGRHRQTETQRFEFELRT